MLENKGVKQQIINYLFFNYFHQFNLLNLKTNLWLTVILISILLLNVADTLHSTVKMQIYHFGTTCMNIIF